MDFISLISKETLIFVAVVYAIGMMLKGTNKIKNWLIPWILLIVSLGLCIALLGPTVNAIVQAVLIVAAAVYGNQLFKQTVEGIKGTQLDTPKEITPTGEVTEFRK
jgi:uncharacterized membrane protein YoaK (UPF0700 family)